MYMPSEIERKFVVSVHQLPELTGAGTALRQGYLAVEDDVEVRVRITPTSAVVTVKVGSGLHRTEVELPLSMEAAEELWPATVGRRLTKVRHCVDLDGTVAEVDVYEGSLAGLCTTEVEFPDEIASRAFQPPPWFGVEVTGETSWSNAQLAQHGTPAWLRSPKPGMPTRPRGYQRGTFGAVPQG